MLTESEKQWLERRRLYANVNRWSHFSCQWCEQLDVNREGYRTPCGASIYGCPRVEMEDMRSNVEDIEFSERVAAKLARWDNEYHKGDHLCPYGDDDLDSYIPLCHCINFCQDHPRLGCIAAKLAWARLAVEEEMDADADRE